jgi:predicted dehydrogenase
MKTARVAIIGASGIGRHHAKWLAALGAEVCAFVGTSQQSVAATRQVLVDLFGFSGAGYTDIATMLGECDPDLVHVCTPPERHYEHVMALAGHRCHVLCEKPLTWAEAKSPGQLLDEARQMVAALAGTGRVAAVNLQYAAVPAAYYDLCRQAAVEPGPPRTFFMHMDSRRERNQYEITWRELSPHTLSVLQAFCGPGEVDYEAASLRLGQKQCLAQFTYLPTSGPACSAEIVVGTEVEGPLTRRLGINGLIADYEGRNNEQGVFRTDLTLAETVHESDDLMYLSLRQWLAAVTGEAPRPLATLADGLRNQEMQLGILARGRRV